jgi:hypothetical protein
MARIKIEDLPVAETLTPEQEELIEGAGLRSFKPTFEAMEAREMMDAGLGGAVLPGLVAPPNTGAPAVAHFREFNPAADMKVMYGALAQSALPQHQAAPQGTLGAPQAGQESLTEALEKHGRAFGDRLQPDLLRRVQRGGDLSFNHPDFTRTGTQKNVVHVNNSTYNDFRNVLTVEFQVYLGEYRYKHDPGVTGTPEFKLEFEFKYEGRRDGVDHFSLTKISPYVGYVRDLDTRVQFDLAQHFRITPGVLERLRDQHQTFSMKADSPLPQGSLDLGRQGLPQGVNAPQGLAGRTIDQIVAAQLNAGVGWRRVEDNRMIYNFQAISATPDGSDFKVLVKVSVIGGGCKEETQTLSIRLTPSSQPGHYTVTSLEQGQQGYQFTPYTLAEMQRAVTDVQFRP